MHHGMFHGTAVVGGDAQGDYMSGGAVPVVVQLNNTSPKGSGVQMSLAMSVGIEADHTV